MSGMDLVKAARQIRSNLPAILCTGYSERMIHDKLQAAGIQAVLLKPIANSDLAHTLRNVLDGRSSPGTATA
jgi:CheY-like chemotaxis protein